MLTKQELKAYTDKDGYDLHQLELDYFQHVILSTLYRNHTNIFFKGGTCLQKVYGIKRFSEDLDFNYKDSIQAVEKTIQNLAGTPSDKNQTQYGTSFKTTFEGILYTGNPQSKCTVSYDFRKNDTYLEPQKHVIRPPYKDLSRYILLALHRKEILAEKIRAVLTRDKPRDLFDIHELLVERVPLDTDLVEKKLQSYDAVLTQDSLEHALNRKKQYYDEELSRLTEFYPSFEEAKEKILLMGEVFA